MAPQALYYCDEHIAANPGANLITAGLSRALPSKPHFTVEGALGNQGSPRIRRGVQSLLALIIKAIAFIHPEQKLTINTGEAAKHFILISRLVTEQGYDVSVVRRERIIRTYEDTHTRPPLNALARVFEVIQRGPPRASMLDAIRAFSVELDMKIALKKGGQLPIEPWKAIETTEWVGHANVVRAKERIEQLDESKHGGSEVLHNGVDPASGMKAITFGFKDSDGQLKHLGLYEYGTEGIIMKDGKVRPPKGEEGRGNRDWTVVKLKFDKPPYDVSIKKWDPGHCNQCGKCIGHADPDARQQMTPLCRSTK